MTHFLTIVIVPKGRKNDIESKVETLLAPFSENLEVAPHKEYLTKSDIKQMARYYGRDTKDTKGNTKVPDKKVFKKNGTIDKEYLVETYMKAWDGNEGGVDKKGAFYWSTYNPSSKWDGYKIGGRWNNLLKRIYGKPKYSEIRDRANYHKCDCCNGTGTREDFVTDVKWAKACSKLAKGYLYPVIGKGCNACQGTGMDFNFSTTKRFPDSCPVGKLTKDEIGNDIITPDGIWHESGKHGWWGIHTLETTEREWAKEVKKIQTKYNGHTAIAEDCHI